MAIMAARELVSSASGVKILRKGLGAAGENSERQHKLSSRLCQTPPSTRVVYALGLAP